MKSYKVTRITLIIIGIIFISSGLIVTSLNIAGIIPANYNWQGPIFLILGIIGFLISYFGLRRRKTWVVVILFFAYIPWTLIGLIGDFKQKFWPLVIGEGVGLVVVFFALITLWKQIDYHKTNE